MLIQSIDGQRVVEINAIDSRLKMACVAEDNGDYTTAHRWFTAALQAERDFWVAKVARKRMLGVKYGETFPAPRNWSDIDYAEAEMKGLGHD